MTVINAMNARQNLYQLVSDVNSNRQIFIIMEKHKKYSHHYSWSNENTCIKQEIVLL